MTDKDFYEYYRVYSPDSSMLLLDYGIKLGALGVAPGGKAILKPNDTTKDLRLFSIPMSLLSIKWLNNQTITGTYDVYPLLRDGIKVDTTEIKINNVQVKPVPYDYISADSELKIEHKETSPDGKYELVAYRYSDPHNVNFIHVSVISLGQKLPKYGNYFIADEESDYILYAKWGKGNRLVFYSNSENAEMIPNFLIKNRPDIDYKIVVDEKTYGGKYLWTE